MPTCLFFFFYALWWSDWSGALVSFITVCFSSSSPSRRGAAVTYLLFLRSHSPSSEWLSSAPSVCRSPVGASHFQRDLKINFHSSSSRLFSKDITNLENAYFSSFCNLIVLMFIWSRCVSIQKACVGMWLVAKQGLTNRGVFPAKESAHKTQTN